MKKLLLILFSCIHLFCLSQTCPLNINYSSGTLTHWYAYTGNNQNGNGPGAIQTTYDTSALTPTGTINATTIPENGTSLPGIQVLTSNSFDAFGGFSTIPVINGYDYGYSIMLGSTSISSSNGGKGGYIRGISYSIQVPNGFGPYTMTYAYAMVLENGSHNSNQQPLLKANLNTQNGSTIACASYSYLLPTLNDASQGGGNATLDLTAAAKEGFVLSNVPSPNNNGNAGESKLRVYYKGWTEVTFDLSSYRGQTVTLTFEADNCVPGGHFAYAYIALRNQCAGLVISGPQPACENSLLTYSIPALTGASYTWTYPSGWQVQSSSDTTNILVIKSSNNSGAITVNANKSGCANLFDTIKISTSPQTIAGKLSGNTNVCTGVNLSDIFLSGNVGNVLKWISSTDSVSWKDVVDTNIVKYTAINLTTSTYYAAVVQNGSSCNIDTSTAIKIVVNPQTVVGVISPKNITLCTGQNKGALLNLTGTIGNIINWQYAYDTLHWNNITPTVTDTFYTVTASTQPTQYRAIAKSGACPSDTSSVAYTAIFNADYPQATIYPTDTTICFGSKALLNTNIKVGTSYTWLTQQSLYDPNNGAVVSNPFSFTAAVAPSKSTNYIIHIKNSNCPNILTDTFRVNVIPPISVFAGRDTFIVANQPLQLNASVNDTGTFSYTWTPATSLNNPSIPNPIATLSSSVDSIRYIVTAQMNGSKCSAWDDIVIKVFKTDPDIFVPSAFTPNNDGKNDILKPIPIGISKFDFFRVYNRWGQMIYSTTEIGKGWDGTVSGVLQPSGTYVFVAQGTDYTGKLITRKGTVVLIR